LFFAQLAYLLYSIVFDFFSRLFGRKLLELARILTFASDDFSGVGVTTSFGLVF
jgi:hypothetical protein